MTSQELQEHIKRIFRSSRNDLLSSVAVLTGPAAVALYGSSSPLSRIAFWIVAPISLISAGWLFFRISRVIFGQTPPTEVVTAIAARGLSPYNESDGPLFWRLGRKSDIRRLVASVHNTARAITVLHGADGAGKTSLLWAGLKPSLEKENIRCAYCDAATSDPVMAASRAIRGDRDPDIERNLEQITLERTRAVLIVDSFEQLNPNIPEHDPFFALLRALHAQAPPHFVQLVIAFRDTYLPTWFEIEQQTGIRATSVPLNFLSSDMAISAMETIIEEADVSIDRSVVRDYIRTAASVHDLSPVDIAVGAQMFESWASRLPNQHLRFSEYAAAGGAVGVWITHVQRYLDSYVLESDRTPLIRGLVSELIDPNTGKRNLLGASTLKLATSTQLDVERLRDRYLPGLASAETRILEAIPGKNPPEYRLARESLVTVLRQLEQEATAPVDHAFLFLLERFGWWKKTRHSRDLLTGDLLTLAAKHSDAASAHDLELSDYVHKSRVAQRMRRFLVGTGVAFAAFIVTWAWLFAGAYIQETKLTSWLLPSGLYEHQDQLKDLQIKGYSVTDLGWLRHVNYRKLEITDSRLTSIAGLSNPRSIEDLTIDLSNTRVNRIDDIARIPALTKLTLFLGRSQVQDLSDLEHATRLNALALYLGGSSVHSVAELGKIKQLRSLTLHLSGSSVRDLTALSGMANLESLTVSLEASQLGMIADLSRAASVHELTLVVENPRNSHDAPGGKEMPNLGAMENLRNFTLILVPPFDRENPASSAYPPIGRLHDLSLPRELRELSIDLGGFPVVSLPDMSDLKRLRHLKLHLQGAGIQRLPDLRNWQALEELDLALDESLMHDIQFTNLKDLQSLSLDIQGANVRTVPSLVSLQQLRRLTLDISQTGIAEIRDLSVLRGLRELNLRLKWAQAERLPSLAALQELRSLSLYLTGEGHNLATLEIGHDLPTLTLGLKGSMFDRLPDLTQFKNVQKLYLFLSGSNIQTLDSLTQAGSVKSLLLDLSDTKMLHKLPDLKEFQELTDLTLLLEGSPMLSLPDLSALRSLRNVTLNLRNSPITDLSQLHGFAAARELAVDQRCSSLKNLPASVERITLVWRP